MAIQWHQGACILCSINCGVRIGVEGDRIAKVKGDPAHPASQGYICEPWADSRGCPSTT